MKAKRNNSGKLVQSRAESSCDPVLDLQNIYPKLDSSIVNTRLVEIEAFNSLPKYLSSSLDFYSDYSVTEFTYLPDSFLYLDLEPVKFVGNEDPVELDFRNDLDKQISLIPLIGHTIIKKLSLEINNQEVTNTLASKYAEEAFLKTVTNFSKEKQDIYLNGAHPFLNDTANGALTLDNDSIQYNNRKNVVLGGFKIATPFLHGVFQCKKLFPPGVPFKLSLYLNSPEYCLLSGEPVPEGTRYDLRVKRASLFVMRVTLSPTETLRQERRLSKKGANYPFVKYVPGSFVAKPGTIQPTIPILNFEERLPQMIHCYVRQKDSLENIGKDPFFFDTQRIKEIYLTLDGKKLPYDIGYTSVRKEVEKNLLLLNLQQNYRRGLNQVDKYNFTNGYGIFSFSLLSFPASLGCDVCFVRPHQHGMISLNIVFKEELEKHHVISWFMEFPTVLHMEPNRKIAMLPLPIQHSGT